MAPSKYSFDVETRHGSRWIIDCVVAQDYDARKRAKELLGDAKCAGVRIIRTWKRPDGTSVDTEIFCETREVKQESTVRVSQVESVRGKCKALKDFLAFDSRQAMSRIFREYLSKVVATPTEIIHNVRHLKRINEKDGLVRSAVEMVAALQTREGEEDARTRRDEIYKALDEMVERASAVDPARLPKLDHKFSEVMGSLGRDIDRDQRNYLMLAALSRELGELPSWLGKLEMLCKLAAEDSDPEALELLDGVIADVLSSDVIQELLGVQASLGTTICAMLDLADGIPPTGRTAAADVTASLCQLLAAGSLPSSRRCIVERAHRALRLPGALRPNDSEQEPAELRRVIARVVTPIGLHSGGDTAHALTIRFARMVEEGGRTGRRAAIKSVFLAMPDMAYGVIYLCDAARSELAREHLQDMADVFDLVMQVESIGLFCHRDLKISERMARATAAYHAMAMSPFSSDLRDLVTGHIDTILERFVVDQKIIEKLDKPDSHLRDRAMKLVRFCDSGLLPKGRALKRAQQRTLALLRQPDFPARFVAGIDDPQAAQTALRDFFALLKSSGMHGGA